MNKNWNRCGYCGRFMKSKEIETFLTYGRNGDEENFWYYHKNVDDCPIQYVEW